MSEYIEREAVLKLAEDGYLAEFATDYARARKRIERIPAADVQPVRTGRWDFAEGHEGIICTACGKKCNGPRIWWKYHCNVPFPSYCENCGAKMEEAP